MKEPSEIGKDETIQKEEVKVYQPLVPFPQRLQQSKLDSQYVRFLNIFKKLEINIPFAEALAQMPHYAKFMKEIISKKMKLDKGGVVNLTISYNAIIQKNLLHKMQDPGSFTIPCTIGSYESSEALCDFGASINLMPLSVVKRLSLGELSLTIMSL